MYHKTGLKSVYQRAIFFSPNNIPDENKSININALNASLNINYNIK